MSRPPRRKPPLSDPGPALSPLLPPAGSLAVGWRVALALLLLLYVCFAGYHAKIAPLGANGYQDAPDEAAHLAYVRTIAAGHLPTLASSSSLGANGYEWHQPPLYYWGASRVLSFGPHVVRWFSIVCGVAALLLIFHIARLIVPDDPLTALTATGIAALTPTHIAITSSVNNDSLLEVCFSAAILLMLMSLRSGFSAWRAGWLGVAIGAACLTKATGVLLLPVAICAFVLYWRSGETGRNIGSGAGWCFGMLLATCGWWFARNAVLYGETLPVQAFNRAFASTALAQDVVSGRIPLGAEGWGGYFALVGQWTFQSFWAVYGTPRSALVGLPVFLVSQAYLLLGIVTAAMGAGLTVLHLRRKTVFNATQQYAIWLLFAVFGLVGLSFLGFILHYFQAQGRYLYPAMSAICVLGAMGWLALFPKEYKRLAGGLLLTLLFALCLAYFSAIANT